MDRILHPVTVSAGRSAQYEGRARRLTASRSSAPDFRSLVGDRPAATAAAPKAATTPAQPAASPASPPAAASPKPATTPAQPAAPPADPVPTAESVFGSSPWMSNPAGQGPLGIYYYNPTYFATAQTAQKVAELLGGKVIQQNAICSASGSPFQQLQPNYMVELPSGRVTNPGLVAAYYTRGYPQSFIDRLLAIEKAESV